MTDDDDGPTVRLVANETSRRYYRATTATGIVDSPAVEFGKRDLATYLRGEPSPDEQSLAEQLGSHSGGAVPMHMFVKLALAMQELAAMATRLDRAWRIVRKAGIAGFGFVLANATCAGRTWLHSHDTAVAAEERAHAAEHENEGYRRATADQIEQLRLDIRQLRERLLRISGGGPEPPNSLLPDPYNKFSSLDPQGLNPCPPCEP